MALSNVKIALESELDAYVAHLRSFAAAKTIGAASDFSFSDECFLEGLLSRIWQSWGSFCRSCVIESCLGTTNSSGALIPGLAGAASAAHVSGAVLIAKKNAFGPFWTAPNSILRFEPTWGDVDILVKIVTRLVPSNSANLLAGFSSSHASAKAIQLIRNASAHNNPQNMHEVLTLRSSYIVFPIVHPIHALFWTEPKSKDFLVMDALEGLKSSAITAIA
jgi:hypothetical protein